MSTLVPLKIYSTERDPACSTRIKQNRNESAGRIQICLDVAIQHVIETSKAMIYINLPEYESMLIDGLSNVRQVSLSILAEIKTLTTSALIFALPEPTVRRAINELDVLCSDAEFRVPGNGKVLR